MKTVDSILAHLEMSLVSEVIMGIRPVVLLRCLLLGGFVHLSRHLSMYLVLIDFNLQQNDTWPRDS